LDVDLNEVPQLPKPPTVENAPLQAPKTPEFWDEPERSYDGEDHGMDFDQENYEQ